MGFGRQAGSYKIQHWKISAKIKRSGHLTAGRTPIRYPLNPKKLGAKLLTSTGRQFIYTENERQIGGDDQYM
jgi:hypothetical protein